jgi:NAD-dependent dihydropyrimidine dehydrogenase PreA subunit
MTRLLLRFNNETVERPITSEVILELGTPINILSARIDQLGGEILADVPPDNLEKVIQAFRSRGVSVEESSLIEMDEDLCIDCGACVSLCPVNAYTLAEDFSVELDQEKCLGFTCGLCIDTCPREALRLK